MEEIANNYPLSPQDEGFQSGVALIRRIDEKGLTTAIQRGINEAIATYDAKIITWMDCDLSMPPEDVPNLVKAIREENADVAVGSRWIPGARYCSWYHGSFIKLDYQ